MYRNLYIVLGGCAFCLSVFFATFTGSHRGRADYVWNNSTEPQTLDPTLMSGQPEGDIAISLHEGLTAYHPETLEPVPAVAESWEVDDVRYTFRLRPDAFWVSGDEIWEIDGRKRHVTSKDVEYSWRRHLHPETGSEYSFLLHHIEGAEEYEKAVADDWRARVEAHRQRGAGRTISHPRQLDAESRRELESFRQQRFRELVRFETPDDTTVVITLKSPAPYFLFLTSFYPLFLVPPEIVEAYGDEWTRPENIVTCGAYYLEEWRFNAFVRLRKNRHYWENEAYATRRIEEYSRKLEAGTIRDYERRELELLREFGAFVENGLEVCDALAVEELNTSVNLYLNGDVDRIRSLPPEVRGDLVTYDAREDAELLHLHHDVNDAIYYYGVNLARPVFRDNPELGRKLRRAMALSIDRDTLVSVVTRGFQMPAYRLIPPGSPGYPSGPLFGSGSYALDLVEAKRLMKEIREGGLRVPKMKVLYNTRDDHARVAAFIQSIWRTELDIDVELANQEWGVYLDSRRTGQFDICRAAWIGDYPDPNTYLDMYTTPNQNNDPKYRNPFYDRVILEYCSRILEHLETTEKRDAMLADIESWPPYRETVGRRSTEAGPSLAKLLRRSVQSYAGVESAKRLERALEIRLLLLQVAEEMLMHDMPTIPIYAYTLTQLWPPELQGIYFNFRDAHPLKTLRWKDGTRPSGSRYDDFPRLSARTTSDAGGPEGGGH